MPCKKDLRKPEGRIVYLHAAGLDKGVNSKILDSHQTTQHLIKASEDVWNLCHHCDTL